MPFSSALMWRSNRPRWANTFLLLTGMIVRLTSSPTPLSATEPQSNLADPLARGQRLYEQACVLCHGKTGEGDGPDTFYLGAYSVPRPRAFTDGEYKFRSTPSGNSRPMMIFLTRSPEASRDTCHLLEVWPYPIDGTL